MDFKTKIGNDKAGLRKALNIYAKKKEGIGYMTRMWTVFENTSTVLDHPMFEIKEREWKKVKSCKGISMFITILGQKGCGLKWSDCKNDEDLNICKTYELEASRCVNSLFYYSVVNDQHFNFDLMLAFLYKYEKELNEWGYGRDLFNKLLNMIVILGFESHLFFSKGLDPTGLNMEGPTDERRDGKQVQHVNEWNRLKLSIKRSEQPVNLFKTHKLF